MRRPAVSVASSRHVMLMLTSVTMLYAFLYCCMLSSALGLLPLLGGAFWMSARVAKLMAHTLLGDGRKYLTRRSRAWFTALTAAALVSCGALVALYPVEVDGRSALTVGAMALIFVWRDHAAHWLTARRMRRTLGGQAYWGMMLGLYVLTSGLAALMLFWVMEADGAWRMLGGFGVGIVLEVYGLWRGRDLVAQEGLPDDIDRATVERMAGELREMNAYSSYQRIQTLVLMALQLTLVLVYSFVGLSVRELFGLMLLTAGCTLMMRELSLFCMRRMRRSYDAQWLLAGLGMWLVGLFLLYARLGGQHDPAWSYAALGACVSGVTVSLTALAELDNRMTDVAAFRLQKRMQGYSLLRAARTEMALLAGQTVALVLLTLLCLPAARLSAADAASLAGSFKPLMIVPLTVMVGLSIVSALRFPMNNRHFQKLARWLRLESEGLDNPALRRQLESVMVKRHKNRFGVRLIILLLRPLYYHRVLGRENLAGYEDGSLVLICNHGEIYGPVVANLYIPVAFRPWVINSIMERDAIVEYLYEGTMIRQKWLPERFKKPLVRLLTPVLTWVFNSLEAIPVYRGKPHELMRTFRLTLEAMQAGDNVLIFPETGEPSKPGEKGYSADNVGEMYTGFAMIGAMYYAKCGRLAAFVPVFANKRRRTLTIGHPVEYNPQNGANEEKTRIVQTLLKAMRDMAQDA